MPHFTSSDGAAIEFQRSGEGPAVIVVDGAFSHPAINLTAVTLAQRLAPRFTVYLYARRAGAERRRPPLRRRARGRGHRRADRRRRRRGLRDGGLVGGGARAIRNCTKKHHKKKKKKKKKKRNIVCPGGIGFLSLPNFPHWAHPHRPAAGVFRTAPRWSPRLGVRYELPVQTERFRPYVAGRARHQQYQSGVQARRDRVHACA